MKRNVTRKLLGLAGSLVLAAGMLMGAASPAAAAACSGTHLDDWTIPGGYISVYYNSSTGYNCALTYTNKPGVAQQIYVGIGRWSSGVTDEDAGSFKYYAGPVYVYAPNACIVIQGRVGTGSYNAVGPLYCD